MDGCSPGSLEIRVRSTSFLNLPRDPCSGACSACMSLSNVQLGNRRGGKGGREREEKIVTNLLQTGR